MSSPFARWPGNPRRYQSWPLFSRIRHRWLVICAACLVLAACSIGVREFENYREAFAKQYEEGESAVARFAATERILWRAIHHDPESPAFEPDYASYYVDSGDPPLAKSVRTSLVALKGYNDSLASLANGNSSEQLSVGIAGVVANLLQSGSNLKLALEGPKAVAAAGELFADLDPVIGTAIAIFKRSAGIVARESFRTQLLEAYPSMRAVLVSLRDYTPQMYGVMHAATVDSQGNITDQAQLDKDRKLLASWVLLMDASLASMEAAYEAIKFGKSNLSLTTLDAASLELRVLSELLRAERMRE